MYLICSEIFWMVTWSFHWNISMWSPGLMYCIRISRHLCEMLKFCILHPDEFSIPFIDGVMCMPVCVDQPIHGGPLCATEGEIPWSTREWKVPEKAPAVGRISGAVQRKREACGRCVRMVIVVLSEGDAISWLKCNVDSYRPEYQWYYWL